MISNTRQVTFSKITDNLFINFPIWFPITYIFLIVNFPSSNKFLFLFSLFLFAETHFASTWLFLFDKENWMWIKTNFYKIIFLPIYTSIIIIFLWYFTPSVVLIMHYLASGWHVTKQSTGILKMYNLSTKLYQAIIYFISFSCLAIGLKNPGIFASKVNISLTNSLLLALLIIYFLIVFLNFKDKLSIHINNLMPLITGVLIYLPILIFKDIATATAVGVGMHWCQYIAIMWTKYFRKTDKIFNSKINITNNKLSKRIFFVFAYSLFMTTSAFYGMPKETVPEYSYSYLYLIPILFQLYHFYIDGFIWKFSDPHIRKSVLPFLYKN